MGVMGWLSWGDSGRPEGFLRGGRGLMGLVPVLYAGTGHALAQTALFDEVLLEAAEVLVDQIIGLVDEAEGDVRHHFGRAGVDKLAVVLVSQRRLTAKLPDILRFLALLVPNLQVAGAEIVFVVVQQFLQAGAGDIGELDFGFLGGAGGLA